MRRPEPHFSFALFSEQIFVIGTIVASRASNMTLLIISQLASLYSSPVSGLTDDLLQRLIVRLLQGFGSAAVLSVGAGSLADMYEKHERGSKVSLMVLQQDLGVVPE